MESHILHAINQYPPDVTQEGKANPNRILQTKQFPFPFPFEILIES